MWGKREETGEHRKTTKNKQDKKNKLWANIEEKKKKKQQHGYNNIMNAFIQIAQSIWYSLLKCMINYQYKYRTNFRQLKKKWMRPGLKTKANSLHFLQKTKRRPMSFHLQSDPYLTWHIECQNTKSQRKHFTNQQVNKRLHRFYIRHQGKNVKQQAKNVVPLNIMYQFCYLGIQLIVDSGNFYVTNG